jgi:hypothetical protein
MNMQDEEPDPKTENESEKEKEKAAPGDGLFEKWWSLQDLNL